MRAQRFWFLVLPALLAGLAAGPGLGQQPKGDPKIPRELVGKWVVVEGPQEGATFDFSRDGRMVGKVNLGGKEGIIKATVRVEGNKLLSTTRNPMGKDETRTLVIRTLNDKELVVVDEQGKQLKLERAPDQGQKQPKKNYSPYADRRYPTRVYWGDQHLHTSFSPDAGLVGNRLSPDDAYRFARGEQFRSSSGQLVQLQRPYDWLVASDHAEYLGLPQAFLDGNPDILKTASGKKWAEAIKKGGKAGYEAFIQMTAEFADGKPSIPREALLKLYRPIWDRAIAAAERNNKPGKFTAFNGFEWTQSIKGNNLHRIVVFRDGPDRTKQVLPFSEFDGTNVEDLWKYLADYEAKTGGRVMAIPHNSNLSCGQMFAPRTDAGKPFDKKYAELRARFEPLAEISQSKGDSETTPELSPHDPFANFERWNKGNIFGMVATTPEMLPFNYCRSALNLGLEHEAKLGVNPFKFGFIGGSDSHTSLSTTRAENYFGVGTIAEPKPERWKEFFIKSPVSPKLDTYITPASMFLIRASQNGLKTPGFFSF